MEKCVNSFLILRFEEHDEQASNQDKTVVCWDDCQLHIKRLRILVLSATFAGDKLLEQVRISLLSIWETDSAVAQRRGNNSTRAQVTVCKE